MRITFHFLHDAFQEMQQLGRIVEMFRIFYGVEYRVVITLRVSEVEKAKKMLQLFSSTCKMHKEEKNITGSDERNHHDQARVGDHGRWHWLR